MANVRFFFRVLHFKIALAKTTMMCNLATEPFETKRKKKKKNRARRFWSYDFTNEASKDLTE